MGADHAGEVVRRLGASDEFHGRGISGRKGEKAQEEKQRQGQADDTLDFSDPFILMSVGGFFH
jgi:hypothetical protein